MADRIAQQSEGTADLNAASIGGRDGDAIIDNSDCPSRLRKGEDSTFSEVASIGPDKPSFVVGECGQLLRRVEGDYLDPVRLKYIPEVVAVPRAVA